MLVVSPHTKFAADSIAAFGAGSTGLVKPIFTRNIVCDKFVGEESRGKEGKLGFLRGRICQCQGTEPCLESVFFLTVEVDLELLGICRCAKCGGAVVGNELIIVYGDVSEERCFQFLGKLEGHVGLIVEILRVIFTLVFHRTKQGGVALVTYAVQLCEPTR